MQNKKNFLNLLVWLLFSFKQKETFSKLYNKQWVCLYLTRKVLGFRYVGYCRFRFSHAPPSWHSLNFYRIILMSFKFTFVEESLKCILHCPYKFTSPQNLLTFSIYFLWTWTFWFEKPFTINNKKRRIYYYTLYNAELLIQFFIAKKI